MLVARTRQWRTAKDAKIAKAPNSGLLHSGLWILISGLSDASARRRLLTASETEYNHTSEDSVTVRVCAKEVL